MYRSKGYIFSIQLLALLLLVVMPFLVTQPLEASTNMSYASMRLNRMAVSVAAGAGDPILVVAKIADAAAGTEAKVKITFGAGFTVGASPTTVTTSLGTYQGHSLTAWPSVQA